MPILTFIGKYVPVNASQWIIQFTCNDNTTTGRCKIRLVDAVFFASSLGTYQGMYRLDSLDGQLRNPSACSNYGGLLLNPFDAGQVFMRDILQNDKSFEFECDLSTNTLVLQMTPATLPPFTNTNFGMSNFDSGFMVFEITKL